MVDKLELAVNEALTSYQNILSNNFRNIMASGTGADSKRPFAWQEYGWPQNPTAQDFYNLYDRQGVAYGVTHLLTDKCWETDPWLVQGDEEGNTKPTSAWEKAAALFFKRSRFWEQLREADNFRLVTGWSGLILQFSDGKAFDQAVVGSTPKLVACIPAWSTQLVANNPVTDERSANYGQPSNWTFKEDNVENPRNLTIHPDRIIILGDWRNGRSALRSCYNDFVNLEKITGGSGESYLKNAARQIAVNYDKDVRLDEIARAHGVELSKLRQLFDAQAAKLNRGIDSLFVTQGGTASPLSANVPDPTPHYAVSMQNIAAAWRLPMKSIVGMQTGERASSEDAKALAARGQGRRTNQLSADVEAAVLHLQRVKLIAPQTEFTVMWDNLTEPTLAERLENADKMAGINQKNAGQGEPPVFSVNDMREVCGYEPLTDAELDVLPDVAPEDDEEGADATATDTSAQ